MVFADEDGDDDYEWPSVLNDSMATQRICQQNYATKKTARKLRVKTPTVYAHSAFPIDVLRYTANIMM